MLHRLRLGFAPLIILAFAFASSNTAIADATGSFQQIFAAPGIPVASLGKATGPAALDANGVLGAIPSPSAPGIVDSSVRTATTLMIPRLMGTTGNEFSLVLQANIPQTSGTASYEKAGLYVRTQSADPSDYTNGYLKDAVAVEGQARTVAGCMLCRVWAWNSVTTVVPGSDAYASGMELMMNNNGSAQPLVNQPTSKNGIHLVAGGSFQSTGAVVLASVNGQRWTDGLVVATNTVANNALSVRDLTGQTPVDIASISNTGTVDALKLSVKGGPSITTTGTGANLPLVLQPAGTGAITLNVPDNTVTGGNARGASALDLQSSRVSATQVASGVGSAILGGQNNAATGQNCTAIGGGNQLCDATFGVTLTSTSSTNGQKGKVAIGAGAFTAVGDAQAGIQVLRAKITTATATTLTTDGAAPTTNNIILLPNSGVFEISCKMVDRDITSGDAAVFFIDNVLVTRGASAAATTIVGTPSWTAGAATAGMSGVLTASVSADTTRGGLSLQLAATNGATREHHAVARCLSTEVR